MCNTILWRGVSTNFLVDDTIASTKHLTSLLDNCGGIVNVKDFWGGIGYNFLDKLEDNVKCLFAIFDEMYLDKVSIIINEHNLSSEVA